MANGDAKWWTGAASRAHLLLTLAITVCGIVAAVYAWGVRIDRLEQWRADHQAQAANSAEQTWQWREAVNDRLSTISASVARIEGKLERR